MTRTIGLVTLVIAAIAAWQALEVWSMLQSCSAKARAIIAAAEPLDRNPPENVKRAIEQTVLLDEILNYLATTLLERYACHGGGHNADWLIDQPMLAWRLRTSFGKTEIFALFTSTADMRRGDIGLNRGARRIYGREVSQLDENELNCLVGKIFGRPSAKPSLTGDVYSTCEEGVPPPPAIDDYGPMVPPQ